MAGVKRSIFNLSEIRSRVSPGGRPTPQVPGLLVVLVGRRRLLLPEVGRRGRALAIASHMSDNLLHVLIVQLRARHRVC